MPEAQDVRAGPHLRRDASTARSLVEPLRTRSWPSWHGRELAECLIGGLTKRELAGRMPDAEAR